MKQEQHAAGAKPEGGFVLISVEQLCAAWSAYAERRIRLVDLRIWFASWEMSARRCTLAAKRTAKFSCDELHQLVGGVGGRHVRASLRRLERSALLCWCDQKIEFPATCSAGLNTAAMLSGITNNRRKVPVPRRILRLLADGGGRVLIATVIAHLLRCLYLRNRVCNAAGTCKASWIAKVFGVDARNVKAARKYLIEAGWLSVGSAPQWRLNRYGAPVRINLAWGGRQHRELKETDSLPRADSPPPGPRIGTRSPLPESDKHLLSEYKNQKPASGRPDGVWERSGKKRTETVPDWRRLCPEDLRSLKRLGILYREAIARKLVARTESSQLAFVAAAVHAQRVARRNTCGLFRTIVVNGLWNFVTQEAEDAARERLRVADATWREPHELSCDRQPSRRTGCDSVGSLVQQVLTTLTSPALSTAAHKSANHRPQPISRKTFAIESARAYLCRAAISTTGLTGRQSHRTASRSPAHAINVTAATNAPSEKVIETIGVTSGVYPERSEASNGPAVVHTAA